MTQDFEFDKDGSLGNVRGLVKLREAISISCGRRLGSPRLTASRYCHWYK